MKQKNANIDKYSFLKLYVLLPITDAFGNIQIIVLFIYLVFEYIFLNYNTWVQ